MSGGVVSDPRADDLALVVPGDPAVVWYTLEEVV